MHLGRRLTKLGFIEQRVCLHVDERPKRTAQVDKALNPPPSRCTHHLCVGDFSQQLRQIVSTQPLVTVVELQATDGCSHAAGGDHGRRVHGQTVICQREHERAISPAAASGYGGSRKSQL